MANTSDARECRHLVITVHGIRTFGDWQGRLTRLLLPESGVRPQGLNVVNYRYGYFSVIAFLIPLLRWLVVRRFREALIQVVKDHGYPARVDLVAHSFGTHVVAWGLTRIPKEQRPKVHTIILAASVLKVGFRWRRTHGRPQEDVPGDQRVRYPGYCSCVQPTLRPIHRYGWPRWIQWHG